MSVTHKLVVSYKAPKKNKLGTRNFKQPNNFIL